MAHCEPYCFYLTPFDRKGDGDDATVEPVGDSFDAVYTDLQTAVFDRLHVGVLHALDRSRLGVFWSKIEESIGHAACLIADITGLNLNVLIEVGAALQTGKLLLLISQDDPGAIPSNIRHIEVIRYENSAGGRKVLAAKVVQELTRHKRVLLDQDYSRILQTVHGIPELLRRFYAGSDPVILRSLLRKSVLDFVGNVSGALGGSIQVFPDQYPDVLGFLQRETGCVVKAVSVVEGEEDFWPWWGPRLVSSTSRRSQRIFLFRDAEQVFRLHQVLCHQADQYEVRVGTVGQATLTTQLPQLDCILFGRTAGASFHPQAVAYYSRAGLDKRVVFSSSRDHIEMYSNIVATLGANTINMKDLPRKGQVPDSVAAHLFRPSEPQPPAAAARGAKDAHADGGPSSSTRKAAGAAPVGPVRRKARRPGERTVVATASRRQARKR